MTTEPPNVVAVFPLPGIVFFPSTGLPLNIFEPRYRAMTAHCIAEKTPIAVPLIAPGREGEALAEPPFASVAGLGELIRHEELPDGRYRIVLGCVARVRLQEFESETPWRQAHATAMPDVVPDEPSILRSQMNTLAGMLMSLRQMRPPAFEFISQLFEQGTEPAVMSNCLASSLFSEPSRRQSLLEECDVSARMAAVLDQVAEFIVETGGGSEAPES